MKFLTFRLDRRAEQFIIRLLRLSLFASLGLEVWLHAWELLFLSTLALILSYVPAWIERSYHIDLPGEFEVMIVVFIYASIVLGTELNFYNRFWWWDIVLHTVSGILLGFVGFLILYVLYFQKKLQAEPLTLAIFAFAFSVAGGAVWEIFEFSMDRLLGSNMQKNSLRDTMTDLIVDTVGALVVARLGYRYLKHPHRGVLNRFILNFLHSNPRFTPKASNK